MREVVIHSEQKKERAVHRPPAETPVVILSTTSSSSASPSRPRRRPPATGKVRKLQDFLVSYDGKFIAHFRAPRPLIPRTAFGQVARAMRSKVPHFDIEKLTLHRPVKLRVGKPSAAEASDRGDFTWFEE